MRHHIVHLTCTGAFDSLSDVGLVEASSRSFFLCGVIGLDSVGLDRLVLSCVSHCGGNSGLKLLNHVHLCGSDPLFFGIASEVLWF